MDLNDPLKEYRDKFHIPRINGREAIYFCGNSLGLQPKTAKALIEQELKDWANLGVKAHLEAKNPWLSYHEMFAKPLAGLVGALPTEVVAMNGLTVNLHLLLISFYRPSGKRFKILCEENAFPSDQYALESQVKFHGYEPDEAIVELKPREGEHTIRTEDVLKRIEELKDELALIMIGGVNYYTGQAFDMEVITKAGHNAGAVVGFDLAHAAGNLKMDLHDWEVDFAVWCSYKYLNSGSGSVAGAFIHQKHEKAFDLPRFTGWWGHDKSTRFLMQKGFKPSAGAEGWQLSNAPVLSMAAHKSSLNIFDEVGMDALRQKSEQLTGYLQFIIEKTDPKLKIITPQDKAQRGCQLSILTQTKGRELYGELTRQGVVADWREPNVIRVAPVPLYNTFEDVYRFGEILEKVIS